MVLDLQPTAVGVERRSSDDWSSDNVAPETVTRRTGRLGPTDLVSIGLALLTPVIAFPAVTFPALVPKLALVIPLATAGVLILLFLALRRELAAQIALAFLGWSALSAALAPSPQLAFVASYGADRGVLVIAAYLGCWALGRLTSPAVRPYLLGAAVAALAINTLVGVFQVTGNNSGMSWLSTGEVRAAGLTPYYVYYGALCAGVLVAAAAAAGTARGRAHVTVVIGAVAVGAFGANVSGSRIALFGGLLLAGLALILTRARLRRFAVCAGAAMLGTAAATLLINGATSTNRVSTESDGIVLRLDMWRRGLEAWSDRPILGWGPGRSQEAIAGRITRADLRGGTGDGLYQISFDAHNVLIDQLVGGGLIGAALCVAFVFAAARRARGPLVWLSAGIALTWLFEPMSVSVAPLALLALGAAVPRSAPSLPSRWRVATLGSAAAGALVAGLLLWGGFNLRQAARDGNVEAWDRAVQIFPRDAMVADLGTQMRFAAYESEPNDDTRSALIEQAEKATQFDPANARWWRRLGAMRTLTGDPEGGLEAYERALELNPWSREAWLLVRSAAEKLDLENRVAEADARLCELDQELCTS